jgi:YHS domain-containing protein
MIFRFILFCILIFVLFRLLKSIFPPRPSADSRILFRNEKGAVNEMVQDPQCGVYVAKKDAYANRVETDLLYFCSEECCHKYLTNNNSKIEKGVEP